MISEFTGAHRFLSNFYLAGVNLDGVFYPTSEHAYQASKSPVLEVRLAVAQLSSPGEAKRYGRTIELRGDWEDVKKRVMALIVMAKFIQNSDLQRQLAQTGDEYLEEGNHWHDNFWGNCTCPSCKPVQGQNWLGRILMFTRDVVVP